MSELRGILQDLMVSPGWKWFQERAKEEWGAGGTRFEGFLNTFADSREDDPRVLQQIRQIAVARREIMRLLQLPSEEVARLAERPAESSLRPPMPKELVGQSRRGVL